MLTATRQQSAAACRRTLQRAAKLAVIAIAILLGIAPRASRAAAPIALLVSEQTTADALLASRLRLLGFELRERRGAVVSAADASGAALCVISESVSSADIGLRLRDIAVPTVIGEPALFDDFGLVDASGANQGWQTTYGDQEPASQIEVVSAGHPLAAGLRGVVTVASPAGKLVWGAPKPEAMRVATIAGAPSKIAVFGYVQGASLYGLTAPAPRVGLFLGRSLPSALTAEGWQLFDAAVRWATSPPRALLVVAASPLSPADEALRNRLASTLGFSVQVKTAVALTAGDASGKVVVVVSESCQSTDVNRKLRDAGAGVVSLEPAIWDDLGMTGAVWQTDFGDLTNQTQVAIVGSTSPLAAGLSGTVTTSTSGKYVWAAPPAGARRIATVAGNSSRATIFAYERAETMAGFTAPGRRVGFFAGDPTPATLTTAGWKLFDAAATWAAGLLDGTVASCDDGNPCTESDRVRGGVCLGDPVAHGTSCADGNVCNGEETCDGAGSCAAPAPETVGNGAACGDACGGGSCRDGACVIDTPNPICALTPEVACGYSSGGQQRVVFTYSSTSGTNVYAPWGTDENHVLPASAGTPPSWFSNGQHKVAFTAELGSGVSWKLGNATAAATGAVSSCSLTDTPEGRALPDGQLIELNRTSIAMSAHFATEPDGLTPLTGQQQVTPDGGFAYNLPLVLPPGRNGVQPSLALGYSSRNNADGVLGVGWTISGLSRINRCPATRRSRGTRSGVTFKSSDQFCLDGNPLVPLPGKPGEYRTRVETFSKIVMGGTNEDGFGPALFKVYTKGGQILTYSRSEAVASLPDGTFGILEWPISTIADRRTNFVQFEYATVHSGDENETRPVRISYTARANVAPTHFVEFKYAPSGKSAGERSAAFTGGYKSVSTSLLTSIDVLAADRSTMVRQYRFGYDTGALTGRSRLRSISECDGASVCRPPLQFEWAPDETTYIRKKLDVPSSTQPGTRDGLSADAGFTTGDVNGDGFEDLIVRRVRPSGLEPSQQTPRKVSFEVYNNLRTQVGVEQSAGFIRMFSDAQHEPDYSYSLSIYGMDVPDPVVTDFDRDGRNEIVVTVRHSSAPSHVVYHGYGFKPNGDLQKIDLGFFAYGFDSRLSYFVADITGEGIPEFIYRPESTGLSTDGHWQYLPISADGSLTTGNPISLPQAFGADVAPLDMDGDGKLDLVSLNERSG